MRYDENPMVKWIFMAGLIALACQDVLAAPTRAGVDTGVQARGVLLMDAASGRILYARNVDARYPPASTVKLMTALLVWEHTAMKGSVRVEASDTRVEPSHVPLRPGESVPVRDLMHSLLISSGNDTAMALGRHVAGTHEEFIRMMNARARQLGANNTVFKNPNGLPAAGQVTTARDMMIIFQQMLAVPELARICGTQHFTLRTAAHPNGRQLRNHNRLLGQYEGMGPAKTGWTHASRHTYAASAVRNGRELHLVLLNSPNKWTDARLLFDYGFSVLGAASTQPSLEARTAAAKATRVHQVNRGETLSSIARAYGVSVAQLAAANRLADPNVLRPGQELLIP